MNQNDILYVSVVTPTYNRRRFIPYLIKCYQNQIYPKEHMEWIIYDDGTDPVDDLFKNLPFPNVRYIYNKEKQNIGYKRNRLNEMAKGHIIVSMDDDDYYVPERVYHVVQMMKTNSTYMLAGSSETFIYFNDNKTIYKFGPYSSSHATNNTMAWTSVYAKTHTYDETVSHAEESSFLENYKHPMIQLDPKKVLLVISHSENTFDKKKLIENKNQFVKKTNMKIEDFMKEKYLRDFYAEA
uniref:Glycosyltransferase 2-like domain-containing protein n=1 Tax=viral metagenome TaxID=1070528 RepID=A0A6C0D6S9_9ZZZZ